MNIRKYSADTLVGFEQVSELQLRTVAKLVEVKVILETWFKLVFYF